MAQRNYKFEKRQKDLAKQKKKDEKKQRKLAKKPDVYDENGFLVPDDSEDSGDDNDDSGDEAAPVTE